MKRNELESMSMTELLVHLVWEPEVAAPYRRRVKELMKTPDPQALQKLLMDELHHGEIIEYDGYDSVNSEPVDYTALIVNREENLPPFIRAVQASPWDRRDVRKPPRSRMERTPTEVNKFLQDMLDEGHHTYQTMTTGQRGFMSTIAHAFSAWLTETKGR